MITKELKTKLERSLDHLESELTQIRTGRANPSLLESIIVEAYGTKMFLRELGSISILDTQNLVVSVWDKGLTEATAKAISESDLKVDPVIEGESIRVPIPSLTEERRKEFVRVVSSKMEESKNSMRNIRQDSMKDIDKEFSDKLIGEDEKFSKREEVEKVVKDFVSRIDSVGEAKKADLLKI